MEFSFLERLPLPKLSTYVIISLIATISSIFHINHIISTNNISERNFQAYDSSANLMYENSKNSSSVFIWRLSIFHSQPKKCTINSNLSPNLNIKFNATEYIDQFMTEFSKNDWCMWSIINMAYCLLVLLGKSIQHLAFGELRISEHQHVREKFWNFVFYKFIFIFGVLNVQTFDEVLLWMAWFSALGFLHLLTTLVKVRFEYLTFSSMMNSKQHIRLLLLTCIMWFLSIPMTYFAVFFGLEISMHVMSFMLAEVLLLNLVTFQVFAHQIIHFLGNHIAHNDNQGRHESQPSFNFIRIILNHFIGNSRHSLHDEENKQLDRFALMEMKSKLDLLFDISILLIDILHHFHMLLWSNIFLSMASLVVLMQLRYLYNEFSKRIRGYRKYKKLVAILQNEFPKKIVFDEEHETCAICWQAVYSYHSLPCCHVFHEMCLYSWVSQDPSCPTCRQIIDGLKFNQDSDRSDGTINLPFIDAIDEVATELGFDDEMIIEDLQQDNSGDEDGDDDWSLFSPSQWLSSISQLFRSQFWLQFFSDQALSQTHSFRGESFNHPVDSHNLSLLSRQVHAMFSDISLQDIRQDLLITRNAEITIENILEGRLSTDSNSTETSTPPNPFSGDQHIPTEADSSLPKVSSNLEESSEPSDVVLSTSFGASTSERELSLHDRKRRMVLQARQRYINQHS